MVQCLRVFIRFTKRSTKNVSLIIYTCLNKTKKPTKTKKRLNLNIDKPAFKRDLLDCIFQLTMSDNGGEGFRDTVMFWNGQVTYTDKSSTLDKQLRSLTTGSSLLTKYVSMRLTLGIAEMSHDQNYWSDKNL